MSKFKGLRRELCCLSGDALLDLQEVVRLASQSFSTGAVSPDEEALEALGALNRDIPGYL